MIAFSPPCFFRAWTAFQPIAASHAHCARYIAWNIGSGMLPWRASSEPKKARKSRWCSALSRSTCSGSRARWSGGSASKPFMRIVCTAARGRLTPNIRIPFARAKRKMSR